jgi:hypothetical protein
MLFEKISIKNLNENFAREKRRKIASKFTGA